MSDSVRDRIAVIQHRRRQNKAYDVLSAISDKLGEVRHAPIDPGLSFRIQCELYGVAST